MMNAPKMMKTRWSFGVVVLPTCILLACGAEGGTGLSDGGTSMDANQDAAPIINPMADTMPSPADTSPVIPDGPPSENITAAEAFGAIAGSYGGTTANVAGGGTADFDNGVKTTFTIAADGKVTFNAKAGALLFDWAVHGRTIKRNPNTKVTSIEMEGPDKRLLTVTSAPGVGLFDVSAVTFNPDGRWYLTAIAKQ